MTLPLLLLSFAAFASSPVQEPSHQPDPAIARILEALPMPAVLLSPGGSKLLILEQPGLRPLAEVASPELRLAGVRINPRNNALSRLRTFGTMIVQPLPSGDPRRIVIPWHSRVGGALWSPGDNRIAFTLIEEGGVSLWVAEAGTGAIRRLSPPNLNGVFGQPCRWLPSGEALVCLRVTANRPDLRMAPAEPGKSVVLERGVENPDLLQNPQDEDLFERYFTSQLVLIPLNGADRSIGTPGLHAEVEVSPDGRSLLVQTLEHPFSYRLSWRGFPRRREIWDLSGALLKPAGEQAVASSNPAAAKAGRSRRSEAPYYEEVIAPVNPASGVLLIRRESAREPPNYFLRKPGKPGAGTLTRITSFSDPAPEFASLPRQTITYQVGGATVSATLYLPPGYARGKGRLPLLIWVTPQAASPFRFVRPEGPSHLLLPFAGYGVLDGAVLPAERGATESRDAYRRRLSVAAGAAVTTLVALGIADPERLAIGGREAEAAAIAELLGQPDRFRAGIVRSGGSGGGGDRGDFDTLKAPLLLIHGVADDSSAGLPAGNRLERLYAALKDQGGPVRLVLIPGEPHGWVAKESVWEGISEMVSWLQRYLKK